MPKCGQRPGGGALRETLNNSIRGIFRVGKRKRGFHLPHESNDLQSSDSVAHPKRRAEGLINQTFLSFRGDQKNERYQIY